MKGKQRVIEAIENHLKIKEGETSRNKKFTLLAANCLGWCHKGPVMLVNDDVYPHVDPDQIVNILDKYC